MTPHCKTFLLVASILLLSCFSISVFAQATPSKIGNIFLPDKIRLERLSALAKVWGTVKYYHPYLAYKNIDWDKALVETIPKINAAQTSQDYKAAIDHLLSYLGDNNTHAKLASEISVQKNTYVPFTGAHVMLNKGTLVIKAYNIVKTLQQEGYSKFKSFYDQIINALPEARIVIFDGRGEDELKGGYFLRQVLHQILDTSIMLGSSRYRYHEGYTPQDETGSAGYFSALLTTSPRMMTGVNKTKIIPIAFLISNYTHEWADIMSGFQTSDRAIIIQEGDTGIERGIASFNIQLTDNVVVSMRTIEYVNPDGSIGFKPDVILRQNKNKDAALDATEKILNEGIAKQKKESSAKNVLISFSNQREKTYPQMEFPVVEYRLLSLFLFWNVIQHFFPYKKLIEKQWDEILPDYIRRFEANTNAIDYQMTVKELSAEIHDSHVGVWPTAKLDESLGKYTPQLQLRYVEKKTMVDKVFDSSLSIKPGDVVTAIDEKPVTTYYQFYDRMMSTSTRETFMRWGPPYLLQGQKDTKLKLTLVDGQGKLRDVEVARSRIRKYESAKPTLDTVEILQNSYGYIDLTRISNVTFDRVFHTLKNTPALILDMRGYPRNFSLDKIVARLTKKRGFIYALHYRPILSALDLNVNWKAGNAHYFEQPFLPNESEDYNGELYKGKIVVLINNNAISAAEHECLLLESAADVTFIGTPTLGANGAITATVLPGNISVAFTGEEIRHADGRQLQRVGIQPHVIAQLTIKGLIEGRDEVLEAAINYLDKNLKK